jgi:hypothetical protein
VNAYAKGRWNAVSPHFTPIELQVIALAAGSPGECRSCGAADSRLRRVSRRIGQLFAIESPAPLANARLEALRQVACNSFATSGKIAAETVAAARSAGLNDRQIESLRDIAVDWHPIHRKRKD